MKGKTFNCKKGILLVDYQKRFVSGECPFAKRRKYKNSNNMVVVDRLTVRAITITTMM